ncbi:MAG: calcium/sodium antiporter [Geminicoccaceae bacterium]
MIWQLLGGLVLLLVGGEALVRGAVAVAERLGVSQLLIGVTLVGIGTSAPELVTCIDAALQGSPGIAIGNVVGSNIANVLLILAIGALLCPVHCSPNAFRRDGVVIALSAIACTIVVVGGSVTRIMGAALLAGLVGYLVWAALTDHQESDSDPPTSVAASSEQKQAVLTSLAMALGGLGAIIWGADLLVMGAIDLASSLGVSETLIGLTIVAVGTSLPELATTVMAAIKREGDVAFGNIIGSSIFNSLGVLGATAVVQPIAIPLDVVGFDIWVMLGATGALLLFAVTSWRINRMEGGALLAGYVAYLGVLIVPG